MPRGWGRGRGIGFLVTGLPGWARPYRGGYCWQYYMQTGQFPPWSPWYYIQSQAQSGETSIADLESLKQELEARLKEIEKQIKELKSKVKA